MLSASVRLTGALSRSIRTKAHPSTMSANKSYSTLARKTASYLLIGDEILSGTVHDTNGPFLAKYFRNRGIDLLRIEVIPDKMDVIVDSIRRARADSNYIVTSGGIGPTHDDITYESIASAFNVPLEYHSETLEKMGAYMKSKNSEMNTERKRMALFPKGSKIHFVGSLWVPIVVMDNVHIFPGVPALFERMLLGSDVLFPAGPPFVQYEVFTKKVEGDFAAALSKYAAEHPDIKIGSYPSLSSDGTTHTRLFIEGRNEEQVSDAAEALGLLTNAFKVAQRPLDQPTSAKL